MSLEEENATLREKLRDMTARALGHAYAGGMAEAGEDLQAQELEYERRSHAETRAQLRIYETALYSIVRSTCCEGCNEAKRVAQTALNTEPSTPNGSEAGR